jgi:hypothetical protein
VLCVQLAVHGCDLVHEEWPGRGPRPFDVRRRANFAATWRAR